MMSLKHVFDVKLDHHVWHEAQFQSLPELQPVYSISSAQMLETVS